MRTLGITLMCWCGPGAGALLAEDYRVVGVVFKDETTPFSQKSVVVEVLGRETVADTENNADGVYYIKIPEEIKRFQLVFRSPNHNAVHSALLTNDRDQRLAKVILPRRNPARAADDPVAFKKQLAMERFILSKTKNPATTKQILSEQAEVFRKLNADQKVDPNIKLLVADLLREFKREPQ